jgi:hypothetical protein
LVLTGQILPHRPRAALASEQAERIRLDADTGSPRFELVVPSVLVETDQVMPGTRMLALRDGETITGYDIGTGARSESGRRRRAARRGSDWWPGAARRCSRRWSARIRWACRHWTRCPAWNGGRYCVLSQLVHALFLSKLWIRSARASPGVRQWPACSGVTSQITGVVSKALGGKGMGMPSPMTGAS